MNSPAHLLISLVFLLTAGAEMRAQCVQTIPYVQKRGRYHCYDSTTRIEGRWKSYHKHGRWTTHIRNAEGKWILAEDKKYWYDNLNGRYIAYDENGDTLSFGYYHRGIKIGEWKDFERGRLVSHCFYDAQGYPTGIRYDYHLEGNVAQKFYYEDTIHCHFWRYRREGTLEERGQMVRGKREGLCYYYGDSKYQSNGDTLPFAIIHFKDGLKDGSEKFYDHGVIVGERNYSNGNYHGPVRVYHRGVLRSETHYVNAHLDGPVRTFFANGNPFVEQHFRDNQLVYAAQFDSATSVRISEKWYTGNRLDSSLLRNTSGYIVYSKKAIAFTNNRYREERFYDNGMHKDSGTTIEGNYSEEYRSWYPNGALREISHRNRNGYHKTLDIWNESGVKVIHAMPSRSHDTIPEEVWSDKGQKLKYGTAAYDAQLNKYLPCTRYEDSVFYLHRMIVTSYMPVLELDDSGRSTGISRAGGTAVQMEIVDSVATNKRTAPEFPGGEDALYRYFAREINYPDYEREMGVEGSNWFSFSVNTDSTISNVQVLKSVQGGPGLQKEVLRVLKGMPKWSPAKKNGKVYKAKCVIEFRWVLK